MGHGHDPGLWFPVGVHACWIVAIVTSARANPFDYPLAGQIWTGAGFPPRGILAVLAMVGLMVMLGRPRPSDVAVRGD